LKAFAKQKAKFELCLCQKGTPARLAYLRYAGDERILVVINPSDREVSFPCEFSPTERIYSFGGELRTDGKTATVPACFAGFYKV